ncbi:hypothetical protein DFH09DRAFT_1316736 [Mycena vulgaris]|nr:hypothetical protein DFH09DRAFT_1316736 [Mycena vulgaris]
MDDLHQLLQGEFPRPTFSVHQDLKWTSFMGSPNEIPPNARHYLKSLKRPTSRLSDGSFEFLDYATHPVYFDPKYHHRPFIPAEPLSSSALGEGQHDLLQWVFDESPVSLISHIFDSESDSDDLVNFTIEEYWIDPGLRLGNRVNDVCMAIARKYEFYKGKNIPPKADETDLRSSFVTEEDTRQAAAEARRAVLDQLGLITWFMTVSWDYAVGLSDEMTQFLIDIRLGERPFCAQPRLEALGYHSLNSTQIPFHYPWTEAEEDDRKFLIYSQAFLTEYLDESDATR